ncbi:acetyltransferase [Macrococcus sp. IME1552]|nr:CatB-related O-acetyltransferase [Macrococcus sp. IME1552]ATD31833.1 acetyltransferase [Macrococcus sp. IME1552]
MNRLIKGINSLRKNYFKKKISQVDISPLAYIDDNCNLCNNVYIDRFCIIHNTQIGSYSYIGYGSSINKTIIGRYCSLASDIKIGLGKHPINLFSTSPIFYTHKNPFKININKYLEFNDESEITRIGNDVWIGANVIIKDGIIIGDGAIIGAGSVVTKNVEPYTIVAGVPAKMIRKRFDDKKIKELQASEWWKKTPIEIEKLDIYNSFLRR